MNFFLNFVRREIVFCVAAFCAVVSAFFVPPSREYFAYIDWNTLFILFVLMGVIAALRSCGVFDAAARVLCAKVCSMRGLCAVLVLLCFFASMFITNDVALLTFVPFSLALLAGIAGGGTVIFVVVLETVAANTGSMLTPLGNPQNLFLFSKMNVGVWDFMKVIVPYSMVSLLMLCAAVFFVPNAVIPVLGKSQNAAGREFSSKTVIREIIYVLLFVLCLLSVIRLVPKWISALSVLLVLLLIDRAVLRSIDYMLLLTFTAFFIFTGNISELGALRDFLQNAVGGNECAVSVVASQGISNVPATLLLYPFAADTNNLLVGVNLGGLGTLVASLASLISFKLYAAERVNLHLPSSARYLLVFTAVNVILLAVLVAIFFVRTI